MFLRNSSVEAELLWCKFFWSTLIILSCWSLPPSLSWVCRHSSVPSSIDTLRVWVTRRSKYLSTSPSSSLFIFLAFGWRFLRYRYTHHVPCTPRYLAKQGLSMPSPSLLIWETTFWPRSASGLQTSQVGFAQTFNKCRFTTFGTEQGSNSADHGSADRSQ